MIPTPTPAPTPAPSAGQVCGHDANLDAGFLGCSGTLVPGHTRCLAHIAGSGRDAYLADLTPGADVDHRDTPFTERLLAGLRDALHDPAARGPRFGSADFRGAQFADVAQFGDAHFSARADFAGARFRCGAIFRQADFSAGADFDEAEIIGGANFDGAHIAAGAHFYGVLLSGGISFHETQFTGSTGFSDARLADGASFTGAQFSGETMFERSEFPDQASFHGAKFLSDCSFAEAQFSGEAMFDEVRFTGGTSFSRAGFASDAWFHETEFLGDADFSKAHFSHGSRFHEVEFGGTANFQNMAVSGDAGFINAHFTSAARFDAARFSDAASFDHTQFAGTSHFTASQFCGVTRFSGTRFSGPTYFDDTQFTGHSSFDDAQFTGDAHFDAARFAGGASFTNNQFSGDALFPAARFSELPRFGPVVCAGTLDLSGAVFEVPVTLETAARKLDCERTRWESTATLRLRYASVDLSHAVLHFPVSLTAHPAPFVTESGTAVGERLLTGPAGVRMASVRGVDAAHLVLTDTDLAGCLFAGAFHLDQLRLEGRCSFASTPTGLHRRFLLWPHRWSRRRTLAEEHHWRAQTAGQPATRGPLSPRGWRPGPHHPDAALTPGPEDVAALYRQLRKAFEDGKNEPGAADFYYGEMEMRRHDHAGTPAGERFLLWGYWLLSGYGLRASRALGWLLAAVAATVVLMMGLGVPDSSPHQVATGTVPAGGGRVTLTVDREDPRLTLPAGDRFTGERADKAVQVVLNSVVFRTSGQDLTTWGTYTEMVSRFTEPVLLALAVLAMRSRIKR
ncbi:pentapeptide repeat-containing protein [Streptomyces sp. NPDC048211]|uniref:pentapeptide repeat-containing protein n=1 Tax=Streptomyces sp. NPDC048211 TaxID=3365516 RepID=UPI00371AEAF1